MASRGFSRALRSSSTKQTFSAVAQQPTRRTLVTAALNAASKRTVITAARPIVAPVQSRGLKTIDFAGVKEDVYGLHNLYQLGQRFGQVSLTYIWCMQNGQTGQERSS